MTFTQSVQLKGVPETLMITLYARAVEDQRPCPVLQDPMAVEILNQLDYDFSKFARGWASQLACVIRARQMDRIVQNFINTHPYAVIVNLGAGLCTRFSRLQTAHVHWYDVDFPEVIDLRRQVFGVCNGDSQSGEHHNHLIAKSILDFTWMGEIDCEPKQPMMVIYEGVAMYLTEAENQALLQRIQAQFGSIEVLFDVISQGTARSTSQHDTVSKTSAEFKWGINRSLDLERWGQGFVLKREEFYLQHFLDDLQRLPTFWRWVSQVFPALPMMLFKNSGRIVGLQVGIQ
ncbi:class I SAM-dependent methyltransferase [Acaryochloris sp. IP29b_bin.137]|uniref:class I SAM-dependent methyltransferase n=1 Tax=Acaryochloris sp. IP29b_bin.137 TaxID=2969217 RepID=UPI00262BA997|nr:class I SAM-dependent methyltransferase [Acaryochloris sp. IP29b_bin.137]